MALTSGLALDVAVSSICAALILSRCGYRIFFPCRVHTSCHRRWRIDDFYMAFALLPLVGRAACVVTSFLLDPDQKQTLPTAEDAARLDTTVDQLVHDRTASQKLLIPSRICYALFLWSLKLCLLSFYSRFVDPLPWGKAAIRGIWWFVIVTFVAVVVATLSECRPLDLSWKLVEPGQDIPVCSRAVINLLTMAICNIITDLALILLPFPILRELRLERKTKLQLSVLFGIGLVVVVITILRVPLILANSVTQRSRTTWASIEILCACIVANTAFFYAVVKDLQGHRHRTQPSSGGMPPGTFYMQSLPSSSGHQEPPETPASTKDDPEQGAYRVETVGKARRASGVVAPGHTGDAPGSMPGDVFR